MILLSLLLGCKKAQTDAEGEGGDSERWDGYYSCFPAEVEVWTPRGPRPIAELRAGDRVYGLVQGSPREGRVSEVHARQHDSVLQLHTELGELRLTPEHPVWSVSRQGWVRAAELHPGEDLRAINGTTRLLEIVHEAPAELQVYDLTVEGAEHTFFAGGLLVHNKSYWYGPYDSEPGPYGDLDGDGTRNEEDCEPSDATIHPGAAEPCDEVDNDCDGQVDEGDIYYLDRDGDGHGDPLALGKACEAPAGSVATPADDCDDEDATVHPGAEELCEGLDNDCDARVDEGGVAWGDADEDGYGDPASTGARCELEKAGPTADNGDDCDDADAQVHPGAAETCDEVDSDCDGSLNDQDATGCTDFPLDADEDGYAEPGGSTLCLCEAEGSYGAEHQGEDCDDSDPTVYPGAEELCDGKDNDCDGRIDSGC